MPSSDLVMAMLRGYATKTKQIIVKYPSFSEFVRNYAETHQQQQSTLQDFVSDTDGSLIPVLKELARDGRCALEYEGSRVGTILLNTLLVEKIRAAYKELEEKAEIPFPTEESLGFELPQNVVTINIKTDLVKWIGAKPGEPQVLRLSFPEDIPSVVATSDLLPRKLLELSVLKIRVYLSDGRNSGYVQQKLRESFTALKDQAIQTIIREIVTRPGQVVENLVIPNEFSFSFWAHLVSLILKEFKAKTDKTQQEQGYCQAAYLIGLYNVFHKGLVQRDRDVDVALRDMESRLSAEPYYFSISDIYNFADEKGVPLSRRAPKERLNSFLEERSRPARDDRLPDLVRLRTLDRKEYFIPKSYLLRLTLSKMLAASRELRKVFEKEWFENLGNFTKTPAMLEDEEFVTEIEKRIAQDDPLLNALLNYNILFLARKDLVFEDEIAKRIDWILDQKQRKLAPVDEILALRRKDILAAARIKLPVWKTIPLLNRILHIFDRMFTRKPKPEAEGEDSASRRQQEGRPDDVPFDELVSTRSTKVLAGDVGRSGKGSSGGLHAPRGGSDHAPAAAGTASAATNKARLAAYRKAIQGLKDQLIGKEVSVDTRLRELSEKWNPLVADKPKQNLIEDVNSFIRDQIRKIRRSLLIKPPDLVRVKNLSAQICESKVFEQIKRKDEFKQYIELYMIKVLGKIE